MLSLLRTNSGYRHLFRALLRWSSSSFSRCWLEHTVLALCFKVLITLNLADRCWWLFHCKYWSVCVGFLYTDVSREPSDWVITIVSRKGMDPSVPASSVVKWMCGSILLMCSRKPCFFVASIKPQWCNVIVFGSCVRGCRFETDQSQNWGSLGLALPCFKLTRLFPLRCK